MKAGTTEHVKFKRLCRRTGLLPWQCVGILESLWLLTARSAPQGDLGRFSNEEIAATIEWEGDEDLLINTLVETGWIDRDEAHRLVIHDWRDHCPNYIKANNIRHGHWSPQSPKDIPSGAPMDVPGEPPKEAPKEPPNRSLPPSLAKPSLAKDTPEQQQGGAGIPAGSRSNRTAAAAETDLSHSSGSYLAPPAACPTPLGQDVADAMQAAALSPNHRTQLIAERAVDAWGERAPSRIREIASHLRRLGKGSGAVVQELEARLDATERQRLSKPKPQPAQPERARHSSKKQRDRVRVELDENLKTLLAAGHRALLPIARKAQAEALSVVPWRRRRGRGHIRESRGFRATVLDRLGEVLE